MVRTRAVLTAHQRGTEGDRVDFETVEERLAELRTEIDEVIDASADDAVAEVVPGGSPIQS